MKKRLVQLLRWSEKYTRTDMLYLASGGFWTSLKYVYGVVAGLITTIALANLIDPSTYGTYQFIISVASIMGAFTLTGMGLAINRAVAQGRDGAFRYGVRTKLIWSIGIVLTAAFIAGYYFLQENTILATSILIAGAFSPMMVSFRLYEQYLSGKKHFKHDAQIEIVRKLLPFSVLLLALFLSDSIILLISAYFIGNALSYLLAYWYILWRYHPPYTPDPDAFTFSKHLSVMNMINKVSTHADKILLWHLLGPTAVATFSISQLATTYSGGVLSSITNVALPKLATRDLPTLQKTLPRKVLLFSGVMGVLALLYIVLAPIVFPFLFPTYPNAVALTQALALTLLFVPRSLYLKALSAHACTRELYYIKTLNPILKLLALGTLIPLFGLWGAVYALLVSGLVETILMYGFFKRAVASDNPTKT